MRTIDVGDIIGRVSQAVQTINFDTPAPVLIQLTDILENEPSVAGRL